MLTLNRHVTTIFYLFVEAYTKLVYKLRFERELFRLSDGGTIALDWVLDHEGGLPRKNSQRPILCLCPGLSGGNDNLYLWSMIKAAQQGGYKCVVVNFRGTSGVPLTSPMVYWTTNWRDVQEPLEYIHGKYCGAGPTAEYLTRKIYGYSVSLGAGILAKYVINSGDKCVLDGVLLYGLFINF